MTRAAAWLSLLSILCGVGCGGADTGSTAPAPAVASSSAASAPTGRIRGVVRLSGDVPPGVVEPITQDREVCGEQAPLVRLTLGPERTVANAFVFLDGVPPTAAAATPQASVTVDQQGCQYLPRAMAMPAGTPLEIINSDPILHNVHAREMAADGLKTVFNIAQPIRGQRTAVKPGLNNPGIFVLTCEAGHPWMRAFVFVADHGYVAVTDANGEFAIDAVPAGTYRLRMWHEGVLVTQIIRSFQRYDYEPPYEQEQPVQVSADGEAVVNFALTLRTP